MGKTLLKVAVTGAAGQIGYALMFRIVSGEMFGKETEIDLSLLEISTALPALKGVVMEIEDCAFPLLKRIRSSSCSVRLINAQKISAIFFERSPGA